MPNSCKWLALGAEYRTSALKMQISEITFSSLLQRLMEGKSDSTHLPHRKAHFFAPHLAEPQDASTLSKWHLRVSLSPPNGFSSPLSCPLQPRKKLVPPNTKPHPFGQPRRLVGTTSGVPSWGGGPNLWSAGARPEMLLGHLPGQPGAGCLCTSQGVGSPAESDSHLGV